VAVVRIDSQDDDELRVDWRATGGRPPVAPDRLPPAIERACRALMARLGLVFGCFDLIVTPSGEHVFLEVNEMGQWLWIEEALPELRLLDRVCEVLGQARPDPTWPPVVPIALADIAAEAEALAAHDRVVHVAPPAEHVAVEAVAPAA
jgi:hypothetical protein